MKIRNARSLRHRKSSREHNLNRNRKHSLTRKRKQNRNRRKYSSGYRLRIRK